MTASLPQPGEPGDGRFVVGEHVVSRVRLGWSVFPRVRRGTAGVVTAVAPAGDLLEVRFGRRRIELVHGGQLRRV